jgi:hypothetical protein
MVMNSTTTEYAFRPSRLRRPRLVQKRAAAWLTAGLLAVPGVPILAAQWLAPDLWEPAGTAGPVELTTNDGNEVLVASRASWDVLKSGDAVSYRSDGALIEVQVYDREGRDLEAVAQRLMRANRLAGINAALTDENIATDDHALSGRTCVMVGDETVGSCAFVADDDVIVWVQVLGTVEDPAPELSDVVGPITRGER